MNYYRELNEGLNRYVERELREDDKETLDEGIFDDIKNKVKDKITKDRFYYVNDTLIGSDSKAEKTFWSLVNSTDMSKNEKAALKLQGDKAGGTFKAIYKDKEGKKKPYEFKIVTQSKETTKLNKEAGEKEEKEKKAQQERQQELRRTVDAKGNIKSKYKLTSEKNEKGEIVLKLGDTELAIYPDKEAALKAIGDAVTAIARSK